MRNPWDAADEGVVSERGGVKMYGQYVQQDALGWTAMFEGSSPASSVVIEPADTVAVAPQGGKPAPSSATPATIANGASGVVAFAKKYKYPLLAGGVALGALLYFRKKGR